MASSTASETLARAQSGEHACLDGLRITAAGQTLEEEADQRRAAHGVLMGIVLGAGAWGAIWILAVALLHRG